MITEGAAMRLSIVIDSTRKGALITQVLTELIWLSIFWIMQLGALVQVTQLKPSTIICV